MNNQAYDPWDEIELSPQETIEVYKNKPDKDPWDELEFNESFWNNAFRYISQVPQGIASTTTPGLLVGLWEMLATGEVYDPEEVEHLKQIAEREGVPFDEEAYYKAAETALGAIPTVSNIAKKTEELTGIPLEPKTRGQKGLRFATEATRLAPQPGTFRGMETSLPRPVLGAGVEFAKEGLQEIGVPEPIAELASFGILKHPPEGAPSIEIGAKTKPSGLPERRFESLEKPKEVPAKKLAQINEKLESDFKTVSDQIIKDSPIGETAENLRNDPTFKQETRELLNQSQEIADSLPGAVPSNLVKKELIDTAAKKFKGYAASEYDKSYAKFMKEAIDDIFQKEISAGQLVEQYRKNNSALSEYFEPGSSKALNRAKRDALLDQNRAISSLMEKSFPESELVPVFKEGNARWTKIMDAEAVDDFISDLFSGERVNYRKMHDLFDKEGYRRIFERSLGKRGFAEFEQLMKDMLTSETPYKMLKVAQQKGYDDLFKAGIGYILHPKLGFAKAGWDATKYTYRGLMNYLIDKPKFGIKFKDAVKDLKKGKFASAENKFKDVQAELMPVEPKTIEQKVPEAIEVKPEKITPETKGIEFKEKVEEKPAKQETKFLEAPKEKKIDEKIISDKEFLKKELIKKMKKPSSSSGREQSLINDEIKYMQNFFSKDEIEKIYKEAFPNIKESALKLILKKHKEKVPQEYVSTLSDFVEMLKR